MTMCSQSENEPSLGQLVPSFVQLEFHWRVNAMIETLDENFRSGCL